MANTVSEHGVISVDFQRIDVYTNLPRWKWVVHFNANQFISIENEGTSWAVKARCSMEQLIQFLEQHQQLAPVLFKLRLVWQTEHQLDKLMQKYKERFSDEVNVNKV